MDTAPSAQKAPYVSVIVPVYNDEKWLTTAVESILKQKLTDLELILVDDGSTDQSGALCNALAEKDPRITVLHQANRGISAARNAGLEVAKGEYLAFCDDDDAYMPNFLAVATDLARQNHADVVRLEYRILHEKQGGEIVELPHKVGRPCMIKTGSDGYAYDAYLRSTGPLFIWNALYRRATVGDLRFDPACRCGLEDFAFNACLHQKIKVAVYSPQRVYLHFERLGGTSTQLSEPALRARLAALGPWMDAEYAAARRWCSPKTLRPVWNERKAWAITFLMHQLRDAGASAELRADAWEQLHARLAEKPHSPFDFLRLAGHNSKHMAAVLLYELHLQSLYRIFTAKEVEKQ